MGALPPVGLPALRLVSGRADQRLSDLVGSTPAIEEPIVESQLLCERKYWTARIRQLSKAFRKTYARREFFSP